MLPLEKEILNYVLKHYENSSKPLLLSELGKELRTNGIWPTEGLESGFREAVEKLRPKLQIIQDPKAIAYLIVVPEEKKAIAEKAIESRHSRQQLKSLPTALLVAFCRSVVGDEKVFFHTKRPFRYQVENKLDDIDYVQIEHKYRMPGINVERIETLSDEDSIELNNKINLWADETKLSLAEFSIFGHKTSKLSKSRVFASSLSDKKLNALERLQAAQPVDIADRVVVPLDIALTLSRLS